MTSGVHAVRMKEDKTVCEETAGYGGAIVLYRAPDGTVSLDAHKMARLFDSDRSVILRHRRNIYDTSELDPAATCAKNARVADLW